MPKLNCTFLSRSLRPRIRGKGLGLVCRLFTESSNRAEVTFGFTANPDTGLLSKCICRESTRPAIRRSHLLTLRSLCKDPRECCLSKTMKLCARSHVWYSRSMATQFFQLRMDQERLKHLARLREPSIW